MLSEYRKLVYADDRYNDTLVRLPEILFYCFRNFPKDFFYCSEFFVFVSFWSCFFF